MATLPGATLMPGVWTTVTRNQAKGIQSGGIQADLDEALAKSVRDSLAILEDTHKRKVINRGGGPPVPRVWTTRSGRRGLLGTYRRDYKAGAKTGKYGSDYWLAVVQEEGKTIRARRKPYLVFKTHDGMWHSVKQVTLPPRPTLQIALRKSLPDRNRVVDKHIDQALREGF